MTGSSAVEAAPPPVRGSKRGWRYFVSAWIPVAVCVLVIAQESTVYFGADHTTGPLRHFFEFFLGPLTQPQWWRMHLVIRKCGHFLGYGILSVAWFRAFWMTVGAFVSLSQNRLKVHSFAMLGTLFVACCDELHQTFLPNRNGSILDVMVDCSGALLMQIAIWLWMRKRFSN